MSLAVAESAAEGFVAGQSILGSATSASCRPSRVCLKRTFDVIGAAILVVLFSPVFVCVAVAVVVDSGRPVVFRQERVGARPVRTVDGLRWELRTFRIFKFRSMSRGADRSPLHEQFVAAFIAGGANGADGSHKLAADPRVTRVGHFLRQWSLDELPQLLNVLRGEMSLVGPRPVPLYEAAAYTADARERLAGRPGMTGVWQVRARAQASFEEMVALDVEYLRAFSFWKDVKLLAMTIPAVVSRRGAH